MNTLAAHICSLVPDTTLIEKTLPEGKSIRLVQGTKTLFVLTKLTEAKAGFGPGLHIHINSQKHMTSEVVALLPGHANVGWLKSNGSFNTRVWTSPSEITC